MAKYNDEFKLGTVRDYLNNEGEYARIAKEWGMPDSRPLKNWVRTYKKLGIEGLRRRKTVEKYSGQFMAKISSITK